MTLSLSIYLANDSTRGLALDMMRLMRLMRLRRSERDFGQPGRSAAQRRSRFRYRQAAAHVCVGGVLALSVACGQPVTPIDVGLEQHTLDLTDLRKSFEKERADVPPTGSAVTVVSRFLKVERPMLVGGVKDSTDSERFWSAERGQYADTVVVSSPLSKHVVTLATVGQIESLWEYVELSHEQYADPSESVDRLRTFQAELLSLKPDYEGSFVDGQGTAAYYSSLAVETAEGTFTGLNVVGVYKGVGFELSAVDISEQDAVALIRDLRFEVIQ